MAQQDGSYKAGRLPPFAPVPWALQDDPDIDAQAVAVYAALKRYADFGKAGGAKVSTRQVARVAGCSAATVKRRRKLLEEKGWLEWQSGQKSGSKNSYLVHSTLSEGEGGSLRESGGSLRESQGGRSERATLPTESHTPRANPEGSEEEEEELELFSEESIPTAEGFIEEGWRIFLEELGGSPPLPKLTQKRREKLEALWQEWLREHAPESQLGVWRMMLEALQASEHHMSQRSYQMPESFLRNEERRERWYMQGLEHAEQKEEGGGSASHSELDLQAFAREEEESG